MQSVSAATINRDERNAPFQYDALVSFVLYNTATAEIEAAVRQVFASPGRFHVALIDNSSVALDLDAISSPEVTVMRPGRNIGYGAGHNLALRQFSGVAPYHFVLNTDVEFGPDVIPGLIRFMADNPRVGMAMPLVKYPNGDIQHLCRLLPRPIDILGRAFFANWRWAQTLTRRYEAHSWPYDQPISFPFLSGCFMAIRAEALGIVGLFDERFFLFAEDLDLSRRFHRTWETTLCPRVSIVHAYRTKTVRSWTRKVHLIRSFVKYFNKYGWVFDRERAAVNQRVLNELDSSVS
jgi:GT2 family glycosyltransferase